MSDLWDIGYYAFLALCVCVMSAGFEGTYWLICWIIDYKRANKL